MTAVAAPPRPSQGHDPEALFEEARRHRTRRRLKLAILAAGALGAGNVALAVLGGGTTSPSTTPVLKNGVLTSIPTRTVVLLVDVSSPMRETNGMRLGVPVAAMQTFIDRLPSRFEIGIVSFDATTRVVQAPTLDRDRLRQALRTLRSQQSAAALGDGLRAAVDLTVATLAQHGIRRAPGHPLPAVIVLESNGAQNRGKLRPPLEAAARAKAAGIRVNGVTLRGVGEFGYGIFVTRIRLAPDPAVAQVARLTGGEAFTAKTTAHLQAIHQNLAATISR